MKFGIDKRRAHLSNLIGAGQLSRDEALAKLAEPIYDRALLADDRRYVLKKLGYSEAEFEQIMQAPRRSHFEYWSATVSR